MSWTDLFNGWGWFERKVGDTDSGELALQFLPFSRRSGPPLRSLLATQVEAIRDQAQRLLAWSEEPLGKRARAVGHPAGTRREGNRDAGLDQAIAQARATWIKKRLQPIHGQMTSLVGTFRLSIQHLRRSRRSSDLALVRPRIQMACQEWQELRREFERLEGEIGELQSSEGGRRALDRSGTARLKKGIQCREQDLRWLNGRLARMVRRIDPEKASQLFE